MKVYISGPIKDTPDYKKNFALAKIDVMSIVASEAWSPAELPDGHTYEWYMRECLRALVTCDAIYMLKGWEKSSGARCEFLCAVMCGMKVLYER